MSGITVAVLGVGAMGEALLAGMLRSDQEIAEVRVADAHAPRADEIAGKYDVRAGAVTEAVDGADVVVVAVKPADVAPLLDEVSGALADGAVVVSVAAGVTLDTIEGHLPDGTAAVRVMPNTPALIGKGVCAMSPGAHCDDARAATVRALLEGSGTVVVVPEKQQDVVTGVSGSGPAYVFHLAEAMIEAGVVQGLTRDVATELVVGTIAGAGALLQETGEHPSLLRERVSSPGGTTVAGLRELDERSVRAAVVAAVEKAAQRSRELSGQ